MVGIYASLFDDNLRRTIRTLPYIPVWNFARFILKYIPKKTDKIQREKHLAYEMRERFGVRVMHQIMKIYRRRQYEKAAPLRRYAEKRKASAIKRKLAAEIRAIKREATQN
jgi:hypothetical protein